MNSVVKKNYSSELQQIDWDFAGENGTQGFSAYHWYPARYVPQLAGILVNYFTEPGQLVLDPFCGSGTTLLEAFKFGRPALGIDLNPIAVLITRAKLVEFEERSFSRYKNRILRKANELLSSSQPSLLQQENIHPLVPNYDENRCWYHLNTLHELGSIWKSIHLHQHSKYFHVGCAAFSSILRYCCSQEKHWGWICDNVKPKTLNYKNATTKFSAKLEEYKISATQLHREAAELQEKKIHISKIDVYEGNATDILAEYPTGTFDLVVTSPPYYNMTDYISSQRLSFLWFDSNVRNLKEKEIGARYKRFRKNHLVDYLNDLRSGFTSIARVLKRNRFCCVVIGESPRYEPFLDRFEGICHDVGLKVMETLSRRIAKQRSLSPILHHEKILVLKKK